MITQGLLTFGAIPAISIDTPQHPEERQRGGGGVYLEMMQHTHKTRAPAHTEPSCCRFKVWMGGTEGESRGFLLLFFLKGCFCEGWRQWQRGWVAAASLSLAMTWPNVATAGAGFYDSRGRSRTALRSYRWGHTWRWGEAGACKQRGAAQFYLKKIKIFFYFLNYQLENQCSQFVPVKTR